MTREEHIEHLKSQRASGLVSRLRSDTMIKGDRDMAADRIEQLERELSELKKLSF